jgi:hypothetical protein
MLTKAVLKDVAYINGVFRQEAAWARTQDGHTSRLPVAHMLFHRRFSKVRRYLLPSLFAAVVICCQSLAIGD